MLYRVIAQQETGEEIMVRDQVRTEDEAWEIADTCLNDHPEWRAAWAERHPLCADWMDDL